MKRIIVAAFVLCVAARPVSAQQSQSQSLDRAEAFAAAGKYGPARTALSQWWSAHKTMKPAEGPLVARALLLRARLTVHPDSAERDYLRIVLEHPSSPQTPEALLRLGQHFLARGDTSRARTYLNRVANDYPGSSQSASALAFLARAEGAAVMRETERRAPEKRVAAREPEKRVTAHVPVEHKATATKASPSPAEKEADTPRASGNGAYSLQSGAFRQQAGATELAARLRKAGYDARVVSTAGGTLRLVRIGRFATTKDAVDVAKNIRAHGFAAVVVDDVVREKAVQ